MAAKIDPDDLIDAGTVAEILGLSSRRAVSVYRTRYTDFPSPAVDMGNAQCVLWLRQHVERWAASRGTGRG